VRTWAAQVNKVESDSMFKMLPGGQDGLVSGAGARDVLLESGLEPAVLRHLWDLSDVDKDGFLSSEEFAVRRGGARWCARGAARALTPTAPIPPPQLCWFLVNQAKSGKTLPERLPPHLVPPARRQ